MSLPIIGSVTEKGQFKDCPRKWYLSNRYPHPDAKDGQLGIETGRPDTFFWFGEVIHSSLEAFYKGLQAGVPHKDAANVGRELFNTNFMKKVEELKEEYGNLFNNEAKHEFVEYSDLGKNMLTNYFIREFSEPLGGPGSKILIVEERFFFSVSPDFTLSGRFDLVIADKNGRIWIVDHKTAQQKPWPQGIELDDQLTGYSFLFAKGTVPALPEFVGSTPAGAIYNVLLKEMVKIPFLEKSGRPSRDSRKVKATAQHYIAFLKTYNFPLAEFETFINDLLKRGWDDFFVREGSLRSEVEIENFEKRLGLEAQLMVQAANNPEWAFPNPGQLKCRGCPFAIPCKGMNAGDDYETMIGENFKPRAPRR